jgi:hypothetical protein
MRERLWAKENERRNGRCRDRDTGPERAKRASLIANTMEGEIMRLIVCLIPLLLGCATPQVRCDAHLQLINPPAPSGIAPSAAKINPARRAP